jgi:hypothetical protein
LLREDSLGMVVVRRLSGYRVVERRLSGYEVVGEDVERIVDGLYMSSGIHDIDHKFYIELMSKDNNKRSKIEQVT